MFSTPDIVHLAGGSSEGMTSLNAFDNALMAAGIHNLNLVRVTSIVPKGAVFGPLPALAVGTVVPVVYSQVTSHISGEVISACVGAGVGEHGGVLMEYHHEGAADDAERLTLRMIEEGFGQRGWRLDDVKFATAEHKVDRLGCAVAAAVLWSSKWS